MPRDLSNFFYPKSVAIIGASRSPQKVGSIVLRNIIDSGFKGKIYPVNPDAQSLSNIPCYRDISSLPESPDLAIVALSAPIIKDSITQIGEKGIKNAIVFAAGFKETGADGAKLEEELIVIANKYGINLLGPNCLGYVNNLVPINATFGEPVKILGNLRFITQSGAIAASLFDWCSSTGLGIEEFVTLGNKAVLNENDFLEYFLNNTSEQVQPVGLYLESISNGQEFLRLTTEITKKNPVFIIKPGKTPAAAHAMQSHTGAIAGEDSVMDAAFNQAGVLRCKTLEDFFDLSRAFSWEKIPNGPKVAVISNAGGPAVISADAVISEGLELAQFDEPTKEKLFNVLPRSASVLNPIDVLGDALADRFAEAVEIILKTDQADSIIVILTPQIMTQIEKTAELIGALGNKYNKPVFCSFIGGNLVAEGERKLNQYKIPSFRFPERAISAIAAMWKYKKFQIEKEKMTLVQDPEIKPDVENIKKILTAALQNKQKSLDNTDADCILKSLEIPVPETCTANSIEEAKQFAVKNGFPVVLKISAPVLIHKKAVGGVITGIKNEEKLISSWDLICSNLKKLEPEVQKSAKIQIQKEVSSGVEVILGVKRDPTFGSVMLFGAGGSYAELIQDRNLHLLPADIIKIKDLVEKSKVFSILKDYNLEKLYELIFKFSNILDLAPEISEVEINPIILNQEGIFSVDTKVLLRQQEIKNTGPKFKTATAISAVNQATTYHYFDFEADAPLKITPGQYISVKVSPERINCYSVASTNGENNFSLFVDTKPGGPGSKYFEQLKVGDKLTFLGPLGTFLINQNDGADILLFLATGSGSSPLRCMIENELIKGNKKTMKLYIGLTSSKDIFWKDYLDMMSQKYPNFSYDLVVWKPEADWNGHTGFITEYIAKDFPDTSKCSAYLCGAKPMIDSATELLLKSGCPKERIYMEKF